MHRPPNPDSLAQRGRRATAAVCTLAALELLLHGTAAQAQYSPNCWRNGKKDFCAITQVAGATTGQQELARIVFADHTVVEVLRNETSCKQNGPVRTCDAKIFTPPGHPKGLPAYYRGTAYEGGYRHEYVSSSLRITYAFLD
ncbi:hypothetical protein KBY71_07740 [Cyanobium sp. T1B-Tous]|uniref:hypothetical protein n=1 Tax=Cyanobium sp. T1B-Tous TaxID=2823721 RepID=UPI0020CC610C|nr:hypothetical protein [Cyanobium sp. T1B-Tous]MCP9806407.1 hypothetical protein [Cyanobium sp. T1B-Tous]